MTDKLIRIRLIRIRKELFDLIRSGERKNRRALLLAYKHVDKAARIMGAPKLDIPKRTSAEQVPTYEQVAQATEPIREDSPVLASNAPEEKPGPEKPRKTRKA